MKIGPATRAGPVSLNLWRESRLTTANRRNSVVTPTGSQAHSTQPEHVPGTDAGYRMTTQTTPAGLVVTVYKGESREWELPPIVARFHRGRGAVYVFNSDDLGRVPATATEIRRGEIWDLCEVHVPEKERGPVAAAVMHAGKTMLPMVPISPRITEATPPLAPTLAPLDTSGDAVAFAQKGWGKLATRLRSNGRLLVGLALASPWTETMTKASVCISIAGDPGYGKSAALAIMASAFGTSTEGRGLLQVAESTKNGLMSYAQDLAHLPVMLDEIGLAPGIEDDIASLVSGASKLRAGRSGASVRDPARWRGACFATGNYLMREKFTLHLFDRRLIEMTNVETLWTPIGEGPGTRPDARLDPVADEMWWKETFADIDALDGHPWHAMRQVYAPGPDAERFVRWAGLFGNPGGGDLIGRVLRAGVAACAWLATWTGEPSWSEGVWEAAVALAAETAEARTDPARDSARQILDHLGRSEEWATDRGNGRAGWTSEHRGRCSIEHDGPCAWVDMASTAFRDHTPVHSRPLAKSAFRKAVFTAHATGLTRTATHGVRVEVVTMCTAALAALAWPTPEETPTFRADVPPPMIEPPTFPTYAPSSPVEVDQEPELDLALYAWTADEDVAAALDRAAAAGITDLTGPRRGWRLDAMREAGWDLGDWTGKGDSAGIARRDGAAIRVRRHRDPETYGTAVEDYPAMVAETAHPVWKGKRLDERHLGMSEGLEAVGLIRHLGEARAERGNAPLPLWDLADPDRTGLPGPATEVWPRAEVAHPAYWDNGYAESHTYWDRVASHLPGITQANLAALHRGETFTRYEGDAAPAPSAKLAGMWQIEVPAWRWDDLPAPLAGFDAGSVVWTSTEVMRLYADRGLSPRVIVADLAPVHAVAPVRDFAGLVRGWREEDRPASLIAKRLYQVLAGKLEDGRHGDHDISRPDWAAAIRDNAWCSLLRVAYKAYDAHGWTPSRAATDALTYDRAEDLPEPKAGAWIGETPGKLRRKG